ncbi:MAG: sugar transferase [Cycloclasticus sp.]
MTLAPIVLFVYNRPWHTKQTIETLQKNNLASDSELFIYSDAAKHHKDVASVQDVRDYIHNVTGFKNIKIIERETNWGLADSIIDGVTTIVNEYGKVIVLEDDLVTSPYFLKYMNDALTFYKDEEKVWHISGWNYPIETEHTENVFLWRVMNCWGWATWSDKWAHYEKDVDKVINEFSSEDKKAFNLDGVEDFFKQVYLNQKGELNTWAIFWYASIFKNNGLCLNPVRTLVDNVGHDGSGVHCTAKKGYVDSLNNQDAFNVKIQQIEENSVCTKAIKNHLQPPILGRALKKLLWK